jgi:hypothetical protein
MLGHAEPEDEADVRRPPLQVGVPVLGDPDEPVQHPQRERFGECGDEVALLPRGHVVDQLVRDHRHTCPETVDPAGGERIVHQAADPGVRGTVGVEEESTHDVDQWPVGDSLHGEEVRARRAQFPHRQQCLDLVVAQHRRPDRRLGVPALRPQPCQFPVRVGGEGGAVQVECAHNHHRRRGNGHSPARSPISVTVAHPATGRFTEFHRSAPGSVLECLPRPARGSYRQSR